MKKLFTTKNLALVDGYFRSYCCNTLVVLIEIPVVFIAPSFYKLDFSEIPILIGTFTIGDHVIRNNYGSYKDCA